MSLNGQVALVTGASRGIGRGIALQLAKAGAAVYITGRSAETLALTVDGMNADAAGSAGSCVGIPVNHSDDGAVEALLERIMAEHGRLDVLVNNA